MNTADVHKRAGELYRLSLESMSVELDALLSYAEHFRPIETSIRLQKAKENLQAELRNLENPYA